jgi:alanyl-tRNA synthetase
MTDKLYYESSHRKDFEAQVISCEPEGEGYKVVLDKTVFFPEGGGQYADTGILGGVHVLDAQEKDGIIYHYTDGALTPGEIVKGEIDWEKRFDSGEHIISGIVHGRFGYNNVGFHLGADYCTMDFDGPITKEQLKEIEEEANRIVYKNLNIEILYPTKEELKDLTYRSKIEIDGQVRIVNIPGVDICACCAPHVDRTGEIGNIKLVDMVSYKGGERITMLSGSRALADHQQKEESVKKISALLCAKDTEVAEAVEKLKEEQLDLKNQVSALKQKLLAYQAKEIDVTPELVKVFDSELSGNEPRELMNLLLERGAKICAIFAGNDEEGYRYVIGSHSEDVRVISKKLNEAFQGRGGGKPQMVQGSLKGTAKNISEIL